MTTAEALYLQEGCMMDYTPSADVAAGQILELSDGRAAVALQPIASGVVGAVAVEGIFQVTKTASIVLLDGGRLYWDYSANAAHFRTVNDRDFYLGTVVGDAASADTTVKVNLNVRQQNTLDALKERSLSVATGTQAIGGFTTPLPYGGSRALKLTATSEVQCVDIFSVDRVDPSSNPIVEAIFRPGVNGSTSDVTFAIGMTNGTTTSTIAGITEQVLFTVGGGATTILAGSKDGTTTVAQTDTTKTISAGSAVANQTEVWIDARDLTNVKLYVDGVQVLSGSTFKLNGATGPFGVLAHLDKATGTATAGPIYVDRLAARIMEQ